MPAEAIIRRTPARASRSLAQLEAIVEKGKTTFIEVGMALREIRDGRLYKKKGSQRNYAHESARN